MPLGIFYNRLSQFTQGIVSVVVLSLEVFTAKLKVRHWITNAFFADHLALARQSCLKEMLKKEKQPFHGLPLKVSRRVKPLILIGSNHTYLIPAVRPVFHGPPGRPMAIPPGWYMTWACQYASTSS